MRFVFLAIIVMFFASSYFSSQRQDARSREQSAILVELESLNHPAVSKLVDEWRLYYPSPTAERVAELKVLAQRVKNDPASAVQFLATKKQKDLSDLPIKPIFGSFKAAPGL